MDNKISFKANLVSNGLVHNNVGKIFEKATTAFPEETFTLTKGDAAEGMQGYIIANLKTNKAITGEPTCFVFKNPTPDTSDENIATKLVRGFKVLIEEAMMNQKKYWLEKQIQRADIIRAEQSQKAEITAKKGLTKISHAYESLAERSAQKVEDLRGKQTIITNQFGKKMSEIAGDDNEVQTLAKVILSD